MPCASVLYRSRTSQQKAYQPSLTAPATAETSVEMPIPAWSRLYAVCRVNNQPPIVTSKGEESSPGMVDPLDMSQLYLPETHVHSILHSNSETTAPQISDDEFVDCK
nr:hypothetical protein CFP56_50801 [Quercus suber]